jgi:hypothetical protein
LLIVMEGRWLQMGMMGLFEGVTELGLDWTGLE